MAEKKQNNTKFDKKKLDDYSSFIKKYILKLLELDTDLYFFNDVPDASKLRGWKTEK